MTDKELIADLRGKLKRLRAAKKVLRNQLSDHRYMATKITMLTVELDGTKEHLANCLVRLAASEEARVRTEAAWCEADERATRVGRAYAELHVQKRKV